jgi:xanthine dehydrogenase molybdopterin-binding subunit B
VAETIDETTAIHQATRIAAREIEGRAVVIVIDRQHLHSLNEVGSRVFALADGRTIGAIADTIAGEFEIDRATALADVGAFVSTLTDLGAIEVQDR